MWFRKNVNIYLLVMLKYQLISIVHVNIHKCIIINKSRDSVKKRWTRKRNLKLSSLTHELIFCFWIIIELFYTFCIHSNVIL